MLARSADNLFWVARYIERADFSARMIDAALRLAALPKAYGGDGTEWISPLAAAGNLELFKQIHDVPDQDNVFAFLAFDRDNPSSIRNCIENARRAARAVRTALTVEMWESINAAWLELRRIESSRDVTKPMPREEVDRFLDFVKTISRDFDGAAYRTMLRNDSYWFNRLGLYMERADNTARVLDVKYHVLLPEAEQVGGTLDFFQWTAILRAVSALTAYHWVYRESIKPWLIMDLLVLRREMPRSLVSCYENLARYLDFIGQDYGQQGVSQRLARSTYTRLLNSRRDEIFQRGLHEFVTEFLADNSRLGGAIAEQYLLS